MNEEKKSGKFHMSLRSFVAVTMIFLLVISLAAVSSIVLFFSYRSTDQNVIFMNENIAGRIADRMLDENYDKAHFDAYVEEASIGQEGRILAIGRDYSIIADSESLAENRNDYLYIVSRDVIDVMTGKKASIKTVKNGDSTVIIPVKDDKGVIRGAVLSVASTARVNAIHEQILHVNVVALFIVLLLGVLYALFVSRVAVRELNSVNEQIGSIAEGNFDTEIEVRGFQEVRYLADNYNNVLGKLDSIDDARQEFVSNVSHELKTPMTSMKVLAESLVQNENASADDYREFMGDIIDEVDRETKLINDLLTLVKTDKRNSELNLEEHSIGELIEIIIKRVSPIAEARGIEIQYNAYKDVIAEVDEVKLLLVISNIITNAIKYNVDNGWVRITLNADAKFFYIKVADSGIGIPDDAKDKVFDRFYRVDKARSRSTGGTGLGLAIARNIIFSHGGTIKLYSEFGNGTTFTIKLPISQKYRVSDQKTGESNEKE